MAFLRFCLSLLTFAAISNSMRYRCDRELTSCGCGYQDADNLARIINGQDARAYSWSMIVSLRLDNPSKHACGGTILSEYFILTAAHCITQEALKNPSIVSVYAGINYLNERNAVIRRADQIHVHANWSGSTSEASNDIALIHLSRPLDLSTNPYLSRTCLPRIESSKKYTAYPPNGTLLMAVGWGLIESESPDKPQVLQQITLDSIHHEHPKCAELIQHPLLQFCSALFQGIGGKDKSSLKKFIRCILSRGLYR